MITGLTKFKERFKGFEEQYVLIGGTACDLIMESEELSFRSTKDLDMLTPLHIDDELSSLSAILLNDEYYELLKSGQIFIDGIPVLKESCLIPLKAKAWLDLNERKLRGEHIDSKNIRKHKNDVFRLAQLISPTSKQELVETIENDMKKFLDRMDNEEVDLKALGIKGVGKREMLDLLYKCYGIKR